MKLFFNKRGESDNVLFPPVVFILANILVFSLLLAFVLRASTGSVVYEQAYAKELALILDKAKSGSEISIDFANGYKIADKNNFGQADFSKLVRVDEKNVYVSLANGGGYSMSYFSNQKVEIQFIPTKNQVVLVVK